jgi:diguanylate cyclase
MISLRRYIDAHRTDNDPKSAVPTLSSDTKAGSNESALLTALRAALLAMGEWGQHAVPSVGNRLKRKMAELLDTLERSPTPSVLGKVSEQVQSELSHWAECALQHGNENEREIKKIMSVVAEAAATIATKDEKYSRELSELMSGMQAITGLNDIAAMRRSIIDTATLLKSCVEKMMEDGRTSTSRLTAEVDEYRSRLQVSEQTAALDPLTGLGNRRDFEKRLESKRRVAKSFSLILIDLNDFKSMNDRYGHLAGDDLLRQFATELRGQLTVDAACRWGGDEFAVIVAGGQKAAMERVDRIRRWVLGEYKINTGVETIKPVLNASFGVVQWDGKESGTELVARADQGLYLDKKSARN